VSPLYFFLKNLATFFSRQFCGVTPDFFFAKTDDLFCSSFYRFYCFHSGVTPLEGVTLHLFYLSDFLSPLFFVNLPTIFFLRVSPPGGCHPGRSVPSPSLVTPLRPGANRPIFALAMVNGSWITPFWTFLQSSSIILRMRTLEYVRILQNIEYAYDRRILFSRTRTLYSPKILRYEVADC